MVKQAADLAIRRPRTVMAVWLVVFAVGLGLGSSVFGRLGGLGGSVPGSESQRTADRRRPARPGRGRHRRPGGDHESRAGRSPPTRPSGSQVASAVAALRAVPGVASVPDPYRTPGMTGDGQVVAIQVGFAAGLSSHAEDTAVDAARPGCAR